MIALPSHGFVVLSMPKCASTSIVNALSGRAEVVLRGHPRLKHMNCRQFHTRMVPILRNAGYRRPDYEVVSLFREPVEWLESWWRYRSRPAVVTENPDKYTGDMTFEHFAERYVAGDQEITGRVGRPARFVSLSNDLDIGVDRIFALDRPETWQSWITDKMDGTVKIGTANVSTERREPELTDATRAALVEHFRPEYDIWSRLQDTGEWAPEQGYVAGS